MNSLEFAWYLCRPGLSLSDSQLAQGPPSSYVVASQDEEALTAIMEE